MNIWAESPILVFAVVLLGLALAARIGGRHRGAAPPRVREDFGVVLTATLTLLGLIIGFTFSCGPCPWMSLAVASCVF